MHMATWVWEGGGSRGGGNISTLRTMQLAAALRQSWATIPTLTVASCRTPHPDLPSDSAR
eukprot:8521450-Pyramimonas_sp.AAC.1